MAEVAAWREEGKTEEDIRGKLKARNYQGPRIAQLLKDTKASAAVSRAMAAPPPAVEVSPAPPLQAQRSEANSVAPRHSYGKIRRKKKIGQRTNIEECRENQRVKSMASCNI